MDVYTQALSPAKREAQGRVAETIFPKRGGPNFYWTVLDSCAKTQLPVVVKNGGDDGTRTRGLCRDRAAF